MRPFLCFVVGVKGCEVAIETNAYLIVAAMVLPEADRCDVPTCADLAQCLSYSLESCPTEWIRRLEFE